MFMRHGEGATGNPNPSPFAMHKLSDEEVEETDTTTLRLKCQLATMTFTPLALPALFLLEEDLQMIVRFPVLCLCVPDTLFSDA